MPSPIKPVLKLKVRGPGIGSGRIPIPDLIRICEEAQEAIKRQAEAMEGRKTVHPGPVASSILEECTLELIKVGRGSTTLEFAFARPQMKIPEVEATALGSQAISEVLASIKSLGNGNKKEINPGVLQSLYEMSGIVGGKRVKDIKWIAPNQGKSRRSITAEVTTTVRERAALRLSSPQFVHTHVDGVLDMADFKPDEHKCRIDPPIGVSVACTFEPEFADQVQRLLRTTVRVTGRAKIGPHADKIEVLKIEQITPLSSLASGQENFLEDSPLSRLAKMQRVKVLDDPRKLEGAIPGDEDVDAFLEEIYSARK